MSLKSKAQAAYLKNNKPDVFKEFKDKTSKGTKLPMHVKKKKKWDYIAANAKDLQNTVDFIINICAQFAGIKNECNDSMFNDLRCNFMKNSHLQQINKEIQEIMKDKKKDKIKFNDPSIKRLCHLFALRDIIKSL